MHQKLRSSEISKERHETMKRVLFSISLILICLLGSCSSFYSDDYSGYGNGYGYYDDTPYYSSQTYSTLYGAEEIMNWPVLVICPMDNFMLQKATETAMVAKMEEYGIEAYAASDYRTIEDAFEQEDTFIRYTMFMVYDDVYTYEIGGGIANLYFDCTIDDMLIFDEDSTTVAKINGVTSSSKNGYLSFGETIEAACKEAGESVVYEYLSYINLNRRG